MSNLTPADLKAIQDEAQSMMNQIENEGLLEDFEFWFGVFHTAQDLLHKRIKELFND